MKIVVNGIYVTGGRVRVEGGDAFVLDDQGNETGIVIKNVYSIELELENN
jgi:hypothetical protein